jgi:neopullulanase
LFAQDALYEGGEGAARQLPTFISNHDQGRFGYFVRKGRPAIGDEEALQRVALAYAMLLTLRGVPVIYYGDEQGFAGTGDDMDSREDMFASRVAQFNAETLIGSRASTASANFNPKHPLFRMIRDLALLRSSQVALRRGRQVVRNYSDKPGLLAVSRIDPQTGRELLIAFNTSATPLVAQVEISAESTAFDSLRGSCASTPSAPGSYPVNIAPLGFIVCAARAPR